MKNISKLFFALALIAAPFSVRADTIFTDNFNSGASPLWGNQSGNWSAAGGVYNAQAPNNNPSTYSSLPFNLTDFTVNVDVNQVSDGGIRLHSDAPGLNGIVLVTGGNDWGRGGIGPSAGTSLYSHVITNGVVSPKLDEAFNVFTPGQNYHLTVDVVGNTYEAFVNGVLETTLVDNTFASGEVGLYDDSPHSAAS
jgi:hypothetical protein